MRQDNNVKHLKAKGGYRKIKSQFSQQLTGNTLRSILPSGHSYCRPSSQEAVTAATVVVFPHRIPPIHRPEMSYASVAVMALMCSSVAIAFVSKPSKPDDALPQDSNSRCHGESLQSIRKGLLAALNLQTEPRLPKGGRKQWSGTAERLKAVEVVSSSSSDGQDTIGCCNETSEVFMTDLGWDNWMIYPERVTLVHCTPCDHSASCRPQPNAPQRDDLQVQQPCCQPTAQEAVPVMYRDEWNTVVITSMHLTRRCGCAAAMQPPQE